MYWTKEKNQVFVCSANIDTIETFEKRVREVHANTEHLEPYLKQIEIMKYLLNQLKNEVITEKQAHQKVLDLFQSILPMSEEEIREWVKKELPYSNGGVDEWNLTIDIESAFIQRFQSQLLSRVEDKKGDRPKVICLCGSTKFKDAFIKSNFEFTMQGYIVLSVGWFSHSDGSIYTPTQKEKIELDELHKRKIDLADEVFIINKDGYIGESTNSELHYAMKKGKKITFMETVSGSFSKSIEDKKQEDVIDLLFTGMYQCECGSESTGSMQFNLCNICGKDIPKKKQAKVTNVEIAKDAEQLFTSQAIQDEMDADMEDGGMAQGEIESCLSHWHNKYLIVMRGELTK